MGIAENMADKFTHSFGDHATSHDLELVTVSGVRGQAGALTADL